jgi:four helix bundle protein
MLPAMEWYRWDAGLVYCFPSSPINMAAKSYENLQTWQRGMELVCEVYRVAKHLPPDERFGLISQLRRAAVSIPANVAEGSGRHARKELLYHLSVARGSLKELETLLSIAERLDYLTKAQVVVARELCDHVSRLLYGMRRKLAA